MFEDDETYMRVLASGALTREVFASLYGIEPDEVMYFRYDTARAIKISIPRPYVQCDLEDGDAYGGQQHAPLVDIPVPEGNFG